MKYLILSLSMLISITSIAQNMQRTTYDDGSVKSEYQQEGKLVAVTNYHQNGEVKETGYFQDGVPTGKWVSYSTEGTKMAELSYQDGKRHGEFRVWDSFENAYMEIHYANGAIITADRYIRETDFAAKDK